MLGYNMYAYCGNNPVMRSDANGDAWYHWMIGAVLVAACAVAVVATAGGAAAGIAAVASVASGTAAATTASTVAAGAFIGASVAYGSAVLAAASTSDSIEEFNEKGDWGTVAGVIISALIGGYDGYTISQPQTASKTQSVASNTTGTGSPKNNINPGGSYTKFDNNGGIYSYTQFDSLGRQTMRIDFQGRPHAEVLPHIHLYTYPQKGGRMEYIFDLNWNLIN